jgi:hypothetical protein
VTPYNNKSFIRIVAGLSLALSALSAHASTLTTTEDSVFPIRGGGLEKNVAVSASNFSTFWTGSTGGGTEVRTGSSFAVFEKFDSSLGTLTGAALFWTSRVSLSRTFESIICNDGGLFDKSCDRVTLSTGSTTGSFNIEVAAGLMASGRTSTTNVARLSLPETADLRLTPDEDETDLGRISVDSTNTGDFIAGSISGFDLGALTGSGDPSDLFTIGTRSIINFGETNINCNASTGAPRDTCSANLSLQLVASNRDVRMVYTYEAPDLNVIPLPAGMPLLLTGLGGLAILRRRRG